MANWFLDLVSGSDNNGGDSFTVTLALTDLVAVGTTTVTSVVGGFTGLAGRKFFIVGIGGRTISSVTNNNTAVLNASVAAGTYTANVGGRRKTTTGFTTANCQAFAGPDVVRFKQSSDHGSLGNATWTQYSRTVTLAAAKTKTIRTRPTDGVPTVSSNVTQAAVTGPSGVASSVDALTVAGAFTTGLAAYDLVNGGGTVDFSGYQQISFLFFTDTAIAAGAVQIKLCSDTAGATPVDTLSLPAVSVTSSYLPITIDKGSALGASIQSIAVYIATDLGAGNVVLRFGDIAACLASSSADALTYRSLIFKDGENPMQIASILGTALILTNQLDTGSGSVIGKLYKGATETVTTYHRLPIDMTIPTSSTMVHNTISVGGTAGNPIVWSGGWDTTDMSTQPGETWINCHHSGYGFDFGTTDYNTFQKIGIFRANRGLSFSGTRLGITLDNATIACGVSAIDGAAGITVTVTNTVTMCANSSLLPNTMTFAGSSSSLILSNNFASTTTPRISGSWTLIDILIAGHGLTFSVGAAVLTITTFNFDPAGSVTVLSVAGGAIVVITTMNGACGAAGNPSFNTPGRLIVGTFNWSMPAAGTLSWNACSLVQIDTVNITESTTATFWCQLLNGSMVKIGLIAFGSVTSLGCGPTFNTGCNSMIVGRITGSLASGVGVPFVFTVSAGGRYQVNSFEFTGETAPTLTSFEYGDLEVCLGRYHDTNDDFRIWGPGFTARGETTIVHGSAVMSWKVSPTFASLSATIPALIPIGPIAFDGGKLVTVTAWMRRSDTGLTARIFCRANQIPGVTTDQVAAMTAAANTWEQLTISFTPTKKGSVMLEAQFYGGTTYDGYVSDMTVTQAP